MPSRVRFCPRLALLNDTRDAAGAGRPARVLVVTMTSPRATLAPENELMKGRVRVGWALAVAGAVAVATSCGGSSNGAGPAPSPSPTPGGTTTITITNNVASP